MDRIKKMEVPTFAGNLKPEIETLNQQIDGINSRLDKFAERREKLKDVFSFKNEISFTAELEALKNESFSLSYTAQLLLNGKIALVALLDELKTKSLEAIQTGKEKRVLEIQSAFEKAFPGSHPSAANGLISGDKALADLRQQQAEVEAWSFSGHERDELDRAIELAAVPLIRAATQAIPSED